MMHPWSVYLAISPSLRVMQLETGRLLLLPTPSLFVSLFVVSVMSLTNCFVAPNISSLDSGFQISRVNLADNVSVVLSFPVSVSCLKVEA